MPELIQNVATQNAFVPALQLGPVKNCKQITFVGLGQPFLVQLWKPNPNDPNGNPVIEGVTRSYPANGGDAFESVSGVAFASAIAGQSAQIYAQLAYATDPLSLGQSITSAVISSSGQIVPPVSSQELAVATTVIATNIASTTEGTPTPVCTAISLTLDGVTKIGLDFRAPYLQSPSGVGQQSLLNFYENGISLGRCAFILNQVNGVVNQAPVSGWYEYTPVAGAYVYEVGAWCVGGTTGAQVGGQVSSSQVPAFLRVLSL